MVKTMKILQISNYFHPHIGGIEQTSMDIATALMGTCAQKVFCFNHEKGNCIDKINGIEIIRAGCFAKVSSQSLSLSYGKLLKKTFLDFQPDIVVFHYPNPFGAHYLKKFIKNYPTCKLIVWWHLDITKQKILGKFFARQTKWLLNRADKVVATSPNYVNGSEALQTVKSKIVVIPSCVSDARVHVDEFTVARCNILREENFGKIICFAIGRHVQYKGIEYLIRASKLLDDRFVIWIGGEGPLTNHLKKLATGDRKICFLGKISDEEVKSRMLACDIFCFPSITKNEAFGLALAEAMSFGKPCVTFKIKGSGVNYVALTNTTCLEVNNRDISAYAIAIMSLAQNELLRLKMGKAAKDRAQKLFTFSAFCKNVKILINSFE